LFSNLEELHKKENYLQEALSIKTDFEALLEENKWSRAECHFNIKLLRDESSMH
jgi:hypothetical protein